MNGRTAVLCAAAFVVLALPLASKSPYLLHIAVITGIYVMLAGVTTGLIVGFPSLRVSRHAFVIVTLAATLLLQLAALNWEDLTRGSLGLPNIPAARLLG